MQSTVSRSGISKGSAVSATLRSKPKAAGQLRISQNRCGKSVIARCASSSAPPAPARPYLISPALSATKPFELHVNETTISVPFSPEAAKAFAVSFNTLLQTFVEKQKPGAAKRWDLMEFKYKGNTALGEPEVFEVACNPNAYPTAFDAKMLITIKSKDGMKIMTEARLSNVKSDLGAFLS